MTPIDDMPAKALWGAVALFLAFTHVAAYLAGAERATDRLTAKYEAHLAERDRAAAESMRKALDEQEARHKAAMDAERKALEQQAQRDDQFRTITKTVTRYVETHPDLNACGLDADGLRLWNEANRGAAGPAPIRP